VSGMKLHRFVWMQVRLEDAVLREPLVALWAVGTQGVGQVGDRPSPAGHA
jgi:hypothetical protein